MLGNEYIIQIYGEVYKSCIYVRVGLLKREIHKKRLKRKSRKNPKRLKRLKV